MEGLETVEVEGKKVILRTDINLPIENGEPRETVRFRRYMETVEELSRRGAKTLVVAHQGRPARKDFLSLEKHAGLMDDYLDSSVEFIRCFFGDEVEEEVSAMESGDVALLENIRFLSEELQNASIETHSQDVFVREIAPHFDMYVDDAFSAAHRSHGSMVGFTHHLDSYPGPVMRKELRNCGKVRDEVENPVLVLGGEKSADIVGILEEMVDRAERILLGGIPGEIALMVQGYELGRKSGWIEQKGFDKGREELASILEKHSEKIETPVDLVTDSGTYQASEVPEEDKTWDIGPETRDKYSAIIKDAESVVLKGPMGAFEDYPDGSRAALDAVAGSEAYTVVGGGHTSSLVQRFGHELNEFDHVSIAGGAFVRYMSGEKLPAVEALKN